MAEILAFLRPEECLTLVELKGLLGKLVNSTQLLAPRGYTRFAYRLGKRTHGGSKGVEVLGMEVPKVLPSSPAALGDRMLRKGRALMHIDSARCLDMVNGTLRVLLPIIESLPLNLLRCEGPVSSEDWVGGRVVITVLEGGGYQVQLQRPAIPGHHSRFEDVFRLTLGPSPVHMTYEFIEEVPEICRHSHEQALLMDERVGAYTSVSFDFHAGVVSFSDPQGPLADLLLPTLRVRFQVAGVYDEHEGVFAWGWAVRGLPEHVREEVEMVIRRPPESEGPGADAHHQVFEAPTISCDARCALILAGFVGHRLRDTHAAIYRYRDARLGRVVYLALENDCEDGMDCE